MTGTIFDGLSPVSLPLSLFLTQMLIITISCRLMAWLLSFLKQPPVVAEIITGIILGPSVLGQVSDTYISTIFPDVDHVKNQLSPVSMMANIGLIMFMFLIGLELNVDRIKENVKVGTSVAFVGLISPFLLGIPCAYAFDYYELGIDENFQRKTFGGFVFFMGIALCITAFPVLARILSYFNILGTPCGVVCMSAAAINDAVAWILLAICVVIASSSGHVWNALYSLLCLIGLVILLLLVVKPLLTLFTQTRSHTARIPLLAPILIGIFVCSWFTEIIGLHSIFGAFVFGLTIPREGNFAKKITERIEYFVVVIMIPFYFAFSGLRTNLSSLKSASTWGLLFLVVLAASLGKFFGSVIPCRLLGLNWRESCAIGISMNTKGLVELIVLNVGYESGILLSDEFAVLVLMALILTFASSPLLYLFYIRPRRMLALKESSNVGADRPHEFIIRDSVEAHHLALLAPLYTQSGNAGSKSVMKLLVVKEIVDQPSSYFITSFSVTKPHLQKVVLETFQKTIMASVQLRLQQSDNNHNNISSKSITNGRESSSDSEEIHESGQSRSARNRKRNDGREGGDLGDAQDQDPNDPFSSPRFGDRESCRLDEDGIPIPSSGKSKPSNDSNSSSSSSKSNANANSPTNTETSSATNTNNAKSKQSKSKAPKSSTKSSSTNNTNATTNDPGNLPSQRSLLPSLASVTNRLSLGLKKGAVPNRDNNGEDSPLAAGAAGAAGSEKAGGENSAQDDASKTTSKTVGTQVTLRSNVLMSSDVNADVLSDIHMETPVSVVIRCILDPECLDTKGASWKMMKSLEQALVSDQATGVGLDGEANSGEKERNSAKKKHDRESARQRSSSSSSVGSSKGNDGGSGGKSSFSSSSLRHQLHFMFSRDHHPFYTVSHVLVLVPEAGPNERAAVEFACRAASEYVSVLIICRDRDDIRAAGFLEKYGSRPQVCVIFVDDVMTTMNDRVHTLADELALQSFRSDSVTVKNMEGNKGVILSPRSASDQTLRHRGPHPASLGRSTPVEHSDVSETSMTHSSDVLAKAHDENDLEGGGGGSGIPAPSVGSTVIQHSLSSRNLLTPSKGTFLVITGSLDLIKPIFDGGSARVAALWLSVGVSSQMAIEAVRYVPPSPASSSSSSGKKQAPIAASSRYGGGSGGSLSGSSAAGGEVGGSGVGGSGGVGGGLATSGASVGTLSGSTSPHHHDGVALVSSLSPMAFSMRLAKGIGLLPFHAHPAEDEGSRQDDPDGFLTPNAGSRNRKTSMGANDTVINFDIPGQKKTRGRNVSSGGSEGGEKKSRKKSPAREKEKNRENITGGGGGGGGKKVSIQDGSGKSKDVIAVGNGVGSLGSGSGSPAKDLESPALVSPSVDEKKVKRSSSPLGLWSSTDDLLDDRDRDDDGDEEDDDDDKGQDDEDKNDDDNHHGGGDDDDDDDGVSGNKNNRKTKVGTKVKAKSDFGKKKKKSKKRSE